MTELRSPGPGPRPAERIAGEFREVFGAWPEGVWCAPGRVNLIGEYTDLNEGFVLPMALPLTVRAAVSRRADGVLRLHSRELPGAAAELDVDGLRPGAGAGWTAYPAGVVWALRAAGHGVGGADVHFASSVPVGSGLASSAAVEVVTALALADLHGLGLGPGELAVLCRRAENEYAGVPCGIMDQTASACCAEGHLLHLDTRDLARRHVPFDLAGRGLRLLVVDTGVMHRLGDGAYARRRASCEEGARALGVRALRDVAPEHLGDALGRIADPVVRARVRHVVTENRRVEDVTGLLDAGDVRAVGPVLSAGHASLRDDLRVSCAELDLAVESANAAGALGARMTGGGFGGSAIALVEAGAAAGISRAVGDAFARAGMRVPRVSSVVASGGARRLA